MRRGHAHVFVGSDAEERAKLEEHWRVLRANSGEAARRLGVLEEAWGGQAKCCPLGLHFAVKGNSLRAAGCKDRCHRR